MTCSDFEESPSRLLVVKRLTIVLWALTVLAAVIPAQTANAQAYKNCVTLKAKYPNGVAVNFGVIGTSGAFIDRAVYLKNQRLDRDKDGIICENEQMQTTTTTTTTIPRTCAQGGRCSVGDKGPGGGIIFYVSSTNQTWGHALEAAPPSSNWNPSGLDPAAQWGCRGVEIPAARGRNVGDGLRNTLAILKDCPIPGNAAHIAESLSFGGKDDWFLPSLEETILLKAARTVVPGLSGAVYWTSTEWDGLQSTERAYAIGFTSPNWPDYANGWKDYRLYVRPIRYVSPVN
jgi:hypothetical protein